MAVAAHDLKSKYDNGVKRMNSLLLKYERIAKEENDSDVESIDLNDVVVYGRDYNEEVDEEEFCSTEDDAAGGGEDDEDELAVQFLGRFGGGTGAGVTVVANKKGAKRGASKSRRSGAEDEADESSAEDGTLSRKRNKHFLFCFVNNMYHSISMDYEHWIKIKFFGSLKREHELMPRKVVEIPLSFDNKLNWRQDAKWVTILQKNTITVPNNLWRKIHGIRTSKMRLQSSDFFT